MLKSERHQQILEMVQKRGSVDVASLCRLFQASEITIRRDLKEMQEKELIIRSHGGAMASPGNSNERAYELRLTHHVEEKQAIAQEALAFLNDGDRVFFDSSTTVYALAKLVDNAKHLTVVTDTLPTALELNYRQNIRVICIGGELKKSTGSCAGSLAVGMLSSMRFDSAFIGLPSLSPDGLMSVTSDTELALKQAAIRQANRLILLVDSSKLRMPDLYLLGDVEQADALITDEKMPASFLTFCRKKRVQVVVAKQRA